MSNALLQLLQAKCTSAQGTCHSTSGCQQDIHQAHGVFDQHNWVLLCLDATAAGPLCTTNTTRTVCIMSGNILAASAAHICEKLAQLMYAPSNCSCSMDTLVDTTQTPQHKAQAGTPVAMQVLSVIRGVCGCLGYDNQSRSTSA